MRKAVIAIAALGLPTLLLVGCPPSFSDFCTGVADCRFDATVQSDAADAGIDAEPECDPDGLFTLQNVDGITDLPWRARHAYFSPDEKTIYFQASLVDGGTYDLYMATRESRAAAFESKDIVPISKISAADIDDVDPAISDDQLTIVFGRGTQRGAGLFMATRSTPTAMFENEQELATLNSGMNEGNPYLALDGGELWFASDRPDGGENNSRLYRALVGGGHFLDASASVVTLPAPFGKATSPVLSVDGRILFFSTFTSVYEARRDSIEDPFKAPRELTELKDRAHEYPSWVSPDGCRLYFHSSDPQIKIYVAVRAPRKTDR